MYKLAIVLFIVCGVSIISNVIFLNKSSKECQKLMKLNKAPINEKLSDYPPELKSQLLAANARYLNDLIDQENDTIYDFEKDRIKQKEQETSNAILAISTME